MESTLTEQVEEMDVYDTILQTIGNTPLVRLNSVVSDLPCTVLAKVEFFNPGGSVKDRIGPAIIADAEQSGRLKPGGTIVESTSGNTGVGLAIAAAIKGYRCIFVMPDKMSQEKILLLRAFGARVVVTPTAVEPEDPRSYYSVAATNWSKKRPTPSWPTSTTTLSIPRPTWNPPGQSCGSKPKGASPILWRGWAPAALSAGTGRYLKEAKIHTYQNCRA